ncbi:MAG: hypothetical protein LC130_08355 [Bryobacterales bacterium]|nr:hypothetical protein [Bryobacterales bacterium]
MRTLPGAALFEVSRGKVYAGVAYHDGDGDKVYYDSKTDRMHGISNLAESLFHALRNLLAGRTCRCAAPKRSWTTLSSLGACSTRN